MQKYLYQDLYTQEDRHWWHRAKRAMVFTVASKFLNQKIPKILDVGCGTGKNLENLNKLGKTWGIDNSKEAIEFCKKRGLVNLKLAEAENTKLPLSYFNLITLLDVLEHTDDNKTLAEMHRILDRKGIIIITVPAFNWLWSNWDVVLHHKRRYTKKSL